MSSREENIGKSVTSSNEGSSGNSRRTHPRSERMGSARRKFGIVDMTTAAADACWAIGANARLPIGSVLVPPRRVSVGSAASPDDAEEREPPKARPAQHTNRGKEPRWWIWEDAYQRGGGEGAGIPDGGLRRHLKRHHRV